MSTTARLLILTRPTLRLGTSSDEYSIYPTNYPRDLSCLKWIDRNPLFMLGIVSVPLRPLWDDVIVC
jgi:hypothetical protein